MNKRVKKKWIEALRSGEYNQTRGRLVRVLDTGEYGFCCLGVLQSLYHEETGTELVEDGFYEPNHYGACKKWSGLPVDGGEVAKLIFFNDEKKLNFNQIADWIEENL